MDAKSQPTQADLGGGVQFASARDDETLRGSASNGTLLFETLTIGPHSQTGLRHGEFRQNVSFDEEVSWPRERSARACGETTPRRKGGCGVCAAKAGQSVEARKAIADGSPVVTSRQTPSKGPEQTTRISGDQLVATLDTETPCASWMERATHRSSSRQRMDRTMRRRAICCTRPLSSGLGRFRKIRASARQQAGQQNSEEKDQGPKMQTTLETAIQDGNVVLTETPGEETRRDRPARNPDRLGAARRVSRCGPGPAPHRRSQDHRRRSDADGRRVDRLSP